MVGNLYLAKKLVPHRVKTDREKELGRKEEEDKTCWVPMGGS